MISDETLLTPPRILADSTYRDPYHRNQRKNGIHGNHMYCRILLMVAMVTILTTKATLPNLTLPNPTKTTF
jgi:hypothetical protein